MGNDAIVQASVRVNGVRPPPGLPPPCGLPSHGSLLHGTGKCKPCTWFWKAEGCGNGRDCGHCHLCPENEIATRRRRRRAKLGTAKELARKEAASPGFSDCDTTAGSDLEPLQAFSRSSSPSVSPRGIPCERRVRLGSPL